MLRRRRSDASRSRTDSRLRTASSRWNPRISHVPEICASVTSLKSESAQQSPPSNPRSRHVPAAYPDHALARARGFACANVCARKTWTYADTRTCTHKHTRAHTHTHKNCRGAQSLPRRRPARPAYAMPLRPRNHRRPQARSSIAGTCRRMLSPPGHRLGPDTDLTRMPAGPGHRHDSDAAAARMRAWPGRSLDADAAAARGPRHQGRLPRLLQRLPLRALTHARKHARARTGTHAQTKAHIRARTHARTHARTCTHASTHTFTQARTHASAHARKHAHEQARTHVPTNTFTHARTHTCTHARTHARTCTHASTRSRKTVERQRDDGEAAMRRPGGGGQGRRTGSTCGCGGKRSHIHTIESRETKALAGGGQGRRTGSTCGCGGGWRRWTRRWRTCGGRWPS